MRVWQHGRGQMMRIVCGHKGPVYAVVFAADGKRIISLSREGIGRVIDAGSDRVLHKWKAHEDWVCALVVGRGDEIAAGDWKGKVK